MKGSSQYWLHAVMTTVFVLVTGTVHGVETAECEEPSVPLVIEADEVSFIDEAGTVEFKGRVEAEHQDRKLNADHVIWDQQQGQVEILGRFTVRFPDGNVLSGENGTFDDALETGRIVGIEALIRGGPAHLLADAGEKTADGNLHLTRATFSPCPISEDDPNPAWRIRSNSILHDAEAQDLIYSFSVLEIGGLPVFVMPYIRQPDPSVERRSGLLSPTMRSNSAYGFGVRVPYHIAIAPDRSATISTFATSKEGVILEGDYDQLYADGDLRIEGSLGHRALLDPDVSSNQRSHGHIFLDLSRESADRYRYGAEVNLSSEKGYLRRYGYSSEDRLRNRAFIERFGEDFQLEAETVAFQTQRDEESGRDLRYTLPEIHYRRPLPESVLGGELQFGGDIRYLNCQDCRRSQSAGLEADWQRSHLFGTGVIAAMHASIRGDIYAFGNQDEQAALAKEKVPPAEHMNFDTTVRALPQAGVEFSLPFLRAGSNAAHIIEPVAQAILAPRRSMRDEIPNEDSLDVEFDEHSLFARNRFSGRDHIETGNRGAYGLRYRYLSTGGLALGGVVGRVVRQRPEESFPIQSGLHGRHSDIVGAWSLRLRNPVSLRMNHRVRLSPGLDMRRNDFTITGEIDRFDLAGTYLFVDADTDRGLERMDRGEIQTRLGADLEERWRLDLSHRRDIEHSNTISVGAELLYEHDCYELLFTAERDYTSSENAPAGTTLGLSLRLLTF